MEKRAATFFLGLLLAGALVLTSCASNAVSNSPTTTPQTTEAQRTTAPTITPSITASAQTPQYGGTISLVYGSDINAFDEVYGNYSFAVTVMLTNGELWQGDWSKGPAGSDETDWTDIMSDRWDQKAGDVAESWDFSQAPQGIVVFKIRKGMHWALNNDSEASRLVGGRELTAQDVVFSLNQVITSQRSFIYSAAPGLRTAEITAPDQYTVDIKVSQDEVSEALLRFGDCVHMVPPEVVQKYGTMQDWRVSVGTGPFMLTDYVPGSEAVLKKNPTYWRTDPVGPGKGNQLPYVNGVNFLIVTDASTRLAAFRTGKIDEIVANKEDADTLLSQHPQLLSHEFLAADPRPTAMRTDKPPFNDVRVRQALMMATDFPSIQKSLFYGEGVVVSWPVQPYDEYKGAYLGLDDPEMPDSVKALYTYNPDQAKELLKEAGYPDGFSTEVITDNSQTRVDYYSVLKSEWAKVGVDLSIKTVEAGVWLSRAMGRNYDQMMESPMSGPATYYQCANYWGSGFSNQSYVDDPRVDAARSEMQALVIKGDEAGAEKMHKDLMKYVLEQAWVIPTPDGYSRSVWWPWLQNYHGEQCVGYQDQNMWVTYSWIDQNVKKTMAK